MTVVFVVSQGEVAERESQKMWGVEVNATQVWMINLMTNMVQV